MTDLTGVATYERPTPLGVEVLAVEVVERTGGRVFALPVLAVASALTRTPGQVRSDALPEHIEYRDEGCCGAFATLDEAVAHAQSGQYCVIVEGATP